MEFGTLLPFPGERVGGLRVEGSRVRVRGIHVLGLSLCPQGQVDLRLGFRVFIFLFKTWASVYTELGQ